jgi:hypothetical protein
MTVERHLILQELTLRPSGEWTSQSPGWVVARVTEGVGYWMQGGTARELNVGDGFITGCNVGALLRSSQLAQLKLQFFTMQPQHLNGVLTVAEWHELEVASNNPSGHVLIFNASELIGQKFSRFAEQSHNDGAFTRCALLQLWVNANAMFKKRFWRHARRMAESKRAEKYFRPAAKPVFEGGCWNQFAAGDYRSFFSSTMMAQTNSSTGDTETFTAARIALLLKMAEADAEEKKAELQKENARTRLETEAIFGKVHRIPVSNEALAGRIIEGLKA